MSRRRRLREVTDDGRGSGITLSPSSVDTQIDSLIVSFENDSMEAEDEMMPEGISIRAAIRRLVEAPDDEEGDEAVASNKEQQTDEPAEPLTPKVNIDEFTERIAMLIETYTKRLDVETVIFNRAKNYLVEEHGEDVAAQFEDILVNEHDIDLRVKAHDEDEAVAPPAIGAGPAI